MADADDSYSVLVYDQQGNICQQTDYDAQGNVVSEMGCETVYDAAGNPQHQKNYYDGVLESEYFYQPNGEGEIYMSQEILYASDCKYISEYDENWNLLSYTTCDLEGKVLSRALSALAAETDVAFYSPAPTEKTLDYAPLIRRRLGIALARYFLRRTAARLSPKKSG